MTSSGTVAVGLLALVLLPVPFLRSISLADLLIPWPRLAALTLLPVLLATVGPRQDSQPAAGPPRPGPAGAGPAAAGPAGRRGGPPPLAAALAALVLVPLCVAALGLPR